MRASPMEAAATQATQRGPAVRPSQHLQRDGAPCVVGPRWINGTRSGMETEDPRHVARIRLSLAWIWGTSPSPLPRPRFRATQ